VALTVSAATSVERSETIGMLLLRSGKTFDVRKVERNALAWSEATSYCYMTMMTSNEAPWRVMRQ
jgi:hypothetical protein